MKQDFLKQQVEVLEASNKILMKKVEAIERGQTLKVMKKKKLVIPNVFSKINAIVGIVVIILVTGSIAYATVPHIFSNGSPANATQVNANFDYILAGTVPSGAIMSFNLTICPTGWIPSDGTSGTPDLRGQFIRGLNTFDGGVTTRADGKQDPDTRSLGEVQDDAIRRHNVTSSRANRYLTVGVRAWGTAAPAGYNEARNFIPISEKQAGLENAINSGDGLGASHIIGGSGPETRSKNVALVYCIKS